MNMANKLVLACGHIEIVAELGDIELLRFDHRNIFALHDGEPPPDIFISGIFSLPKPKSRVQFMK